MLVTECSPCCATPTNTAVPGTQGPTGPAGASAWTTLSRNFTIPALSSTGTMWVASSSALAQNQIIFCGGANFIISSIGAQDATGQYPLTVQPLGVSGDSAAATVIAAGAIVLTSLGNITFPLSLLNGGTGAKTAADALTNLGLGGLALPVPIASGGTGATTTAVAQTNLGFGKAVIASYVTGGTTQIATTTSGASSSTSTGISITLAESIPYRIHAYCRLDGSGATVSAGHQLGLKLRKTSGGGADLTSAASNVKVPAATTLSHTFAAMVTPVVTYSATANDVIAIYAQSSASTSAGNIQAVDGWIIAFPQY